MRVLILAAGRGERLRPLTDQTPKPLLEAGGRPLIEYLIAALVRAGLKEIVINLAHLGERIRTHLGTGRRLGADIVYSTESEALETGGGILNALPLLGTDPFLVVNGDIATDYSFTDLSRRRIELAHLVLVPNPHHHPEGDFVLREGRVTMAAGDRYTFAGMGVYRAELFAGCAPGKFPLAPLLCRAMAEGRVTGELYEGFWMDIGTVDRLQELDRRIRGGSRPSTDGSRDRSRTGPHRF